LRVGEVLFLIVFIFVQVRRMCSIVKTHLRFSSWSQSTSNVACVCDTTKA